MKGLPGVEIHERCHGFELPADVWRSFAAEHWGRGPAVIKQPFAEPLAEPQDIEQVLRGARAAWYRNDGVDFGLWLDGAHPVGDFAHALIDPKDQDLGAYVNRVAGSPPQRELCLAQFNAQLYHPALWQRCRRLLRGLYRYIGLPAGTVDTDVFFGRYRQTPRGIHTDSADTFMYVVHGTKQIVVWPREYFLDPERRVHASGSPDILTLVGVSPLPYLEDGIVLEGQPGDLLYWPSTYWHVGIHNLDALGPGGYSAALNMGIFAVRPTDWMAGGLVHSVLGQLLAGTLGTKTYPVDSRAQASAGTAGDCVSGVPAHERAAVAALSRLLASDASQRVLSEEWLRRLSADGFRHVPDPDDGAVPERGAVKLADRDNPIRWQVLDDSIVMAGNGHLTTMPYSPELCEKLAMLAGGQPVDLRSADVISTLYRWRSVVPSR
jgi:hypothetical protein